MMVQAQNDQFLLLVFIAIAIIIPAVVLWFDDGSIHSVGKRA